MQCTCAAQFCQAVVLFVSRANDSVVIVTKKRPPSVSVLIPVGVELICIIVVEKKLRNECNALSSTPWVARTSVEGFLYLLSVPLLKKTKVVDVTTSTLLRSVLQVSVHDLRGCVLLGCGEWCVEITSYG